MKPVNLMSRRKSPLLKVMYIGILFLIVFSGILFLYGYLWETMRTAVARSVTPESYFAKTPTSCVNNADCVGACKGVQGLKASEACLCLNAACYFVINPQYFSENKFCDTDSDCIVSCYEGPVSHSYYDRVNGTGNDCEEGCRVVSDKDMSGKSTARICRDHQCQFADGHTCFVAPIPFTGKR